MATTLMSPDRLRLLFRIALNPLAVYVQTWETSRRRASHLRRLPPTNLFVVQHISPEGKNIQYPIDMHSIP